jgi:uncharacterized membrane protein
MSLAAFFDGIVLHQLLQWHHMLSSVESPNTVAGLEANTFWDGVFLFGAAVLTIAGLTLLWRSSRQGSVLRSAPFVGALMLGAGLFNMVEGLIDHHLLGIHHVKSGVHQSAWDIGFLVVSAILGVSGWLILRSQRSTSRETT